MLGHLDGEAHVGVRVTVDDPRGRARRVTARELLEETVAKAQSTAQEARLVVGEAAAEAASAAPSPTKAEMDQAQQVSV